MGLKQLDNLMKPRSIAVIGASNQENRPGNIVMRNLLAGGFDGAIMPVTPNYKSVCGVLTYSSIDELPIISDLAIICTRATRVPAIILQLGRKGTRAAIVIAAGLETLYTAQGTNLLELMMAMAKEWKIRILGANSLGLLVPRIGLNASYAQTQAKAGRIALISQSTSVCVTLLDWAKKRGIGFSAIVDLGNGSDISFAEMLDYLGRDPHTAAILLYVDSVDDGRRFFSAARAASMYKPLIVIKSRRFIESSQLLDGTNLRSVGKDAVYDAVFKRAGMLRVADLRELLAAVETLANGKPIAGEQLIIIGNGNAASAMVLDMLLARGGKPQKLPDDLVQSLNRIVRAGGRSQNPINLLGDASPDDYYYVLDSILNANLAENVLILHSPSSYIPPEKFAARIIERLSRSPSKTANIFVNFMGEDAALTARKMFTEAGIASFRTPEGAVSAFMHMVQFKRNQKLLSETPDSIDQHVPHLPTAAQQLVKLARASDRTRLTREQSAEFLRAYGIDYQPFKFQTVESIGNPQADSLPRVEDLSGAHQLRIEMHVDPIFGPTILLGEMLRDWDISKDAVVGLAPLNIALARYLVIQALAEQKIRERSLNSLINRQALSECLVKLSQLIIDNPEISAVHMSPVLVSELGVSVLDATIKFNFEEPRKQTAIQPYPKHLEDVASLKNGLSIVLRPLRAEDERNLQAFDNQQTKEDRFRRYFGEMPKFTHDQMVRLTQLDYAREMAFIAVSTSTSVENTETILGVVRAQRDPDNLQAEFAMAIRSSLKGQGLGAILLQKMISYLRSEGTQTLVGSTMLDNNGMANLARKLGFKVRFDRDDELIQMHLDLNSRV